MANTPTPAKGQVWRRKKDGRTVVIEKAVNTGSRTPFHDITWATVEPPLRRGDCYENYWLRDYELVHDGSTQPE